MKSGTLRGYRKLLLSFVIIGIAATVDLTPTQASVIMTVAGFMLGSNAAVHIGGSIAKAIGSRTTRRDGGSDGDTWIEGQESK